MSKRILLLSAYDALSHQRWRQGLVDHFPEYHWTVLTQPARYFNWRVRGNAMSWACDQKEILSQNYDLLLTTSMTDLASLRGLVPGLSHVPTCIYFHENQFVYPHRHLKGGQLDKNERVKTHLEAKITSIYSALAADQVVFNSEWNRDSFLAGVDQFLKSMPDAVPTGIVESLADRSSTLPVPLDDICFTDQQSRKRNNTFTILWNHRWEYDKAPERFFTALIKLKQLDYKFKVHVIGQQFRSSPSVFYEVKDKLADELLSWGYMTDEAEYRQILNQCDVVVSTALHDFQGLAVLEAVAAGCIPVVPDRLAYRQFIPDEFLFHSYPDDFKKETGVLTQRLADLISLFKDNKLPSKLPRAPNMEYLRWDILKSSYQAMLNQWQH